MMKRRTFLKTSGLSVLGSSLVSGEWLNAVTRSVEEYPELGNHTIKGCELMEVEFNWPRFVGKNGKIDFHGQYKKSTVLKVITDQGAIGWGLSERNAEKLMPVIQNRKVAELIVPGQGLTEGIDKAFDFALHDLMGVILNQPVYKLLGNKGAKENPVYSGMIYLDELNPGNESKGLDIILENCEWDYNYGYRQLKIKTGRSGRWYPHKTGLEKDIEVVKLIQDAFDTRNTELLVDSNDMYSCEDTICFLRGIHDIPLVWIEEPFRENLEDGRKLRKWMNENGFEKTLYADGEANPDFDVCLQLGSEKVMNVFLPDTYGYGFSKWQKLIPELEKIQMKCSPHAWGDLLKTHYTAHLAAGLGNIVTIEGVTCSSDHIDYGDYPIIDGRIKVSESPGFGMRLLK